MCVEAGNEINGYCYTSENAVQQNAPEERFDRKTSFKVYLRFSLFERRATLKLFFNHKKQAYYISAQSPYIQLSNCYTCINQIIFRARLFYHITVVGIYKTIPMYFTAESYLLFNKIRRDTFRNRFVGDILQNNKISIILVSDFVRLCVTNIRESWNEE